MSIKLARSFSAFVITSLVLLSTGLRAQESTPKAEPFASCSNSLWEQKLVRTPAQEWNLDTGYLLGKRKDPDGTTSSYYYTADILRLTPETIGSLLKTPAAPSSGMKRLTFDARVIEIDAPLVFENGSVTLIADQIVFKPHGAIVFTNAPQGQADGVTLIAESVDFTNALYHPLQFVTVDKDWPANTRRIVKLTTPHLISRLGASPDVAFLKALTLDNDYAEVPDGFDLSGSYELQLDHDKALEAFRQSLSKDMLWPDQTVTKITRMFALAPFDKVNLSFLSDRISDFQATFRNTEQDNAKVVLTRIKAAIDTGQDYIGFTRYEVPRRTFPSLLEEFDKSNDEQLKVLADWDTVIAAAHMSRKQVTDAALTRLDKQLIGSDTDKATLSSEIGQLVTDISNLEQDVASKEPLINQRLQADTEAYQEDLKHSEDAAKIAVATKALSIASACLPVATPVALGISVAVGTAGSFIAKKQTGEAADVGQAILTIPETLAQAKQFRAKAEAAGAAWDKFHKAEDDYNTATTDDKKKEASDRRLQGLSDFGSSVGDLLKGLSLPKPAQLKENEYQLRDTKLQGLLRETEDLRSQQTSRLELLAVKHRELEKVTAGQEEALQARKSILQADPQNDVEMARLEALGWSIRGRVLSSLAFNAAVLARAYQYHTTFKLDSPIDEKYFWTVYSPNWPQAPVDPSGSSGRPAHRPGDDFFRGGSSEEIASELARINQQLRRELAELSSEAKEGYAKYKLGIVGFAEETLPYQFDCAKQDARCEFLKSLNAEIDRQVRATAAGNPLQTTPMLIPLNVTGTHSSRPDRLVDISVDVKFRNPSAVLAKTIRFSVIHPIYGKLTKDNKCYTVDFRKTDAVSNEQEYPTVCQEERGAATCTHLTKLTREDYQKESEGLVFMPFETVYLLKVDVQDARNVQIPAVEQMKFQFRVLH